MSNAALKEGSLSETFKRADLRRAARFLNRYGTEMGYDYKLRPSDLVRLFAHQEPSQDLVGTIKKHSKKVGFYRRAKAGSATIMGGGIVGPFLGASSSVTGVGLLLGILGFTISTLRQKQYRADETADFIKSFSKEYQFKKTGIAPSLK